MTEKTPISLIQTFNVLLTKDKEQKVPSLPCGGSPSLPPSFDQEGTDEKGRVLKCTAIG